MQDVMQMGNIIRKYRKAKNLTQGEMAKRLGVTPPAVNKWERGYSMPDISLLSPIARLLDISTDTLLSHEKELSDAKANELVEEAIRRLKSETFEEVFQWGKKKLTQYPNSAFLALWMMRVFDAQRKNLGIPDPEKYDGEILKAYQQLIESEQGQIRNAAAEALYNFFFQKEQYEQAEQYLSYVSEENPERKRKQAMIYSKTGRLDQAYQSYEEILYTGYQGLNATFRNLYLLSLEKKDLERGHMLADKLQGLAALFDFGEYHRISAGLELAIMEKDQEKTVEIVKGMLETLPDMGDFVNSPLYAHLQLKSLEDDFLTEMRKEILENFRNDDQLSYLKGNEDWHALIGEKEALCFDPPLSHE